MAQKTFEKALKELEQIVSELESGDLPLEKTIKKFEEGIKLSNYCSRKLDETEKKVLMLTEDNQGNPVETPFSAANGGDTAGGRE